MYSKNSIFGATQSATRALPGHLMMGRSMIGAKANLPGARVMSCSSVACLHILNGKKKLF
jgi:hypothetical protein